MTVYLALFIFFVGLLGAIHNDRNFLITMLSLELTYLGVIVLILNASLAMGDFEGRIDSLVILVIAAAESALGLGILIVLFRYTQNISFSAFQILRS